MAKYYLLLTKYKILDGTYNVRAGFCIKIQTCSATFVLSSHFTSSLPETKGFYPESEALCIQDVTVIFILNTQMFLRAKKGHSKSNEKKKLYLQVTR